MSQQQLLPAYLVVGADEYRRSRIVKRMRARLERSGMLDFNLDERDMTKAPQVDDIVASLNTLPMGAEFRLVILEGCDRLSKDVSEPLIEYLSNPSPTTVCMVVAERLAKNTRLYKAFSKIGPGAILDCSPIKSRELPKHVVDLAGKYGGSMTFDAAEEFASRVGDSTRLIDSELRKLLDLVPEGKISLKDVERHIARTAEVKPWGLIDAISARDALRSFQLLAIQPKGTEVWIHSLIVARLRELIVAKVLDSRGQAGGLAARLGMQGWQVRNHVRWARAFSMDELLEALDAAVETELALKGSRDSDVALRMLIASIVR